MRVACFGGSFNPPHVGHAMVASWLLWTERVEEVWLIPTFVHAFDKDLAPFSRRYDACERLAALLGPRVRALDIEAHLPAPSYTVHTLDALAQAHPGARLQLVLGADNLSSLQKWKNWRRIEAEYSPIVVGRGEADVVGAPTFPDVSSTEVRRRLAAGLSVDALVPAAVLAGWRAGG